jgi:hypothetical protein
MGGQAVREPKGLHHEDRRRPDLQIVFPGQHLLTDVTISHPLTRARCMRNHSLGGEASVARAMEARKRSKYALTASRQDARLLPFAMETCGGMAPDAVALLKAISQGAQEQLGLWPHYEVIRHLVGSIAVAVQKGNALMVLQAYSTALAKAAVEGDDASAVAAEK